MLVSSAAGKVVTDVNVLAAMANCKLFETFISVGYRANCLEVVTKHYDSLIYQRLSQEGL